MSMSGILTSTIAAAALLMATPVLAEESNESPEPLPRAACCERTRDHAAEKRADGSARDASGARRVEQATAVRGDEDLFQQRPYWSAP